MKIFVRKEFEFLANFKLKIFSNLSGTFLAVSTIILSLNFTYIDLL